MKERSKANPGKRKRGDIMGRSPTKKKQQHQQQQQAVCRSKHGDDASAGGRPRVPGRNRSRAGCITCKQKHVKCDEARPTCHKCAQKGWVCGGYSSGIKWSYKHQPFEIQTVEFDSSPKQRRASSAEHSRQRRDQNGPASVAASPKDAYFHTLSFDNMFSPSDLLGLDPPQNINMPPPSEYNLALSSPIDAQQVFWPLDEDAFEGAVEDQSAAAAAAAASAEAHPPLDLTTLSPSISIDEGVFDTALDGSTQDHFETMARQIPRISSPGSGPEASWRLINNWFDQVCPAWSGFDSSMNMNRKIASELWDSSGAVFHSLQSMSASFVSARVPHMKVPARNLLKTATQAIQSEVNAVSLPGRGLSDIPTGLLFSLCCLGTTICWLDPRLIGVPFLEQARNLLRRAMRECPNPNPDQQAMLSFFKKSLVYWEMLVAVVEDVDPRKEGDAQPLSQVIDMEEEEGGSPTPQGEASTDVVAHPWTGISSMTASLFSRSMRLCRTYRRRITNPTGRASSLSTAMRDIEEAQRLEEKLLELDFSADPLVGSDTGDGRTPRQHLAHVAEAYQLASLLQLYSTFPDLVSIRLPHESDLSREGDVPWDKWIIPLTLRLTSILEQIPPDSGSKVIQPLLYICASAGLRYNLSSPPDNMPLPRVDQYPQPPPPPRSRSGSGDGILDYVDQVDPNDAGGGGSGVGSIPHVALEIGNARNFIMRRLSILESTLQPKPIIVAQELVKAIWDAYDREPVGSTSVHWVDVMERTDLRSLFG